MNDAYFVLETMASLLLDGYPLQEVLSLTKLIAKDKSILKMEKALANGQTLQQVILAQPFPKLFKEFFHFFSMQREMGQAILQSIKICKEKDGIMKKIQKELAYPAFLLIFIFFFAIFVTYFLLPQIEILFLDFAISPPAIFTIVFVVLKWIPVLLVVLIGSIITFSLFTLHAVAKNQYRKIDYIITYIPIYRTVIRKYYSMKFAIYYHELASSGYDSTEILNILSKQMLDKNLKMLIYEIQSAVLQGEDLSKTISSFLYFEEMLSHYFILLLSSPKHKEILQEYIKMNIAWIHKTVQKVTKILIPSVYGFVVVFVVSVYLGIILPIMDVVGSLS